jgi:hypothetical protein
MRRDFLKYCSLAGLGLALPSCPKWAGAEIKNEPYPGPYYVVLNAVRRVGHDISDGPQGDQ